jgi:hypothetical protein
VRIIWKGKTKQNGDMSKIGTYASGITGKCPNIAGFVHCDCVAQNHFNPERRIAEHRKPKCKDGCFLSTIHNWPVVVCGCCVLERLLFSGDTGRVNQ